jgi:iron complex outermembrane recepter protein
MIKTMAIRTTLLVFTSTLSVAGYAMADSSKRIDIPSGDLSRALLLLSKQYGADLIYRPEQVNGIKTHGAHGELTTQQAVVELLKGTRLELRTDADGAMLITIPGANPISNSIQSTDGAGAEASPAPAQIQGPSRSRLQLAQADRSLGQVASSVDGVASNPDKTSGSNTSLEEVVVTAEKKSESEMSVPISMAVVPVGQMLDAGISRLDDYYSMVPGLAINDQGSGRSLLVIRGIAPGITTSPTVGVTIDDIPFGSSALAVSIPDLDPFDLDHVEVLRGPQGTLYGSNSMGGLVKYVTVAPDPDHFSGRVETDGSSTDHGGEGYGVRAAVNLPLIEDTLGVRVSVFRREDPGYIDDPEQHRNNVNVQDATGGRLSAVWNVSDIWKVHASALVQDTSIDASNQVDLTASMVPVYGAYEHERLPGTDGTYTKVRLYSLSEEAQLPWLTFNSISGFGQFSVSGPQQDVTSTFGPYTGELFGGADTGAVLSNWNNTNKFTQEFRFASPDPGRPLQWLAGAFYTKEQTSGFQIITATSLATGTSLGYDSMYTGSWANSYEEKAAFGSLTYQFTQQFDVQAGGRFSSVHQQFANYYGGILSGGDSSVFEHANNDVWIYNFAPRFRFTPDIMAYVRVASGYRAGGANALIASDVGAFPSQFTSDSLTSYDVGSKAEFLEHSVSVDTSLFYIDWRNIQTMEVSAVSGESYTVNAGTAKSEGVEEAVSWVPLKGLTLAANGSFSNAVLTQNAPDGTYGLAGARLPYSPRWSGNLSAQYAFPIHAGLDGYVGAAGTYVGDRFSEFESSAATPRARLPSYTTARLDAGVKWGGWNVSAYVKNITDNKGYLAVTDYTTTVSTTTGATGYGWSLIQPRTVGITASYQFSER